MVPKKTTQLRQTTVLVTGNSGLTQWLVTRHGGGLKAHPRLHRLRELRVDLQALVQALANLGDEKAAGIKSRDFLRLLISGREILIETQRDKKGKYGRYLGEVYLSDKQGGYINVNDYLVEEGYAEYAEY